MSLGLYKKTRVFWQLQETRIRSSFHKTGGK